MVRLRISVPQGVNSSDNLVNNNDGIFIYTGDLDIDFADSSTCTVEDSDEKDR